MVVLVAKFVDGAWITVIFIPMLILIFRKVRRHYHAITVATTCTDPVSPANHRKAPIAVVPMDRWSSITKRALEFASRISPDIIAVHIQLGEHAELFKEDWDRYVATAFRDAGETIPTLTVIPSPYRFVIIPLVQHVLKVSAENPDRRVVVLIPTLVEGHWFEYLMHNHRSRLLEWALLANGNRRIYTLSTPYYLPKNA